MVRFVDGTPQAVWFSQHDYGTAISYAAVHKIGKRPVAFSAKGSHANYLTGEAHDLSHSSKPSYPLSQQSRSCSLYPSSAEQIAHHEQTWRYPHT